MKKGKKDCHLVLGTQRAKEGKYLSQATLWDYRGCDLKEVASGEDALGGLWGGGGPKISFLLRLLPSDSLAWDVPLF